MTPKTAHVARTAEIEQAVLVAARDLLAEGGIDALSMRVVAERVGVSAPAIYHYFDNKEELVRRVVAGAFHRFGEYLAHAADAHPVGSLARIRALGLAYIRFAMDHQAYFRVLFSIQRNDPRAIEDLPEGGGYDLFRQAIVDAIDAGRMRHANPDLIAMYLWCVVHGLVMISLACRFEQGGECATDLPGTPEELFAAFAPLVEDGIRAPGARQEVGDGT